MITKIFNSLKLRSRQFLYCALFSVSFVANSANLDEGKKSLTSNNLFSIAEITGTVLDNTGIPLPGADVFVKGTQNGVQTDFDGKFILELELGDVMVVSYVGFATQEVIYTGQAQITITLVEDVNVLDDIVVVGYGVKKASEVTTSISKVGSEKLNAVPAGNVLDAIGGRAAGVQVLGSGEPGADSNVLIRGVNTFGNARPLIVADGVFVDNINSVNQASIESIEILKDAAAASIYGSRASNGVIIITTKRGKVTDDGKAKISFSSYGGVQYLQESKFFDVISGKELYEIGLIEDLTSANTAGDGRPNYVAANSPERFFLRDSDDDATDQLDPNFVPLNTDWQKSLYRLARISNYDLRVSGAGSIGNYNLNVGLLNQEGVQKNTGLKKYSVSLNTQFKISEKLKVSQILSGGLSKFQSPLGSGGRSLQTWSTFSVPYLPEFDDQGRYVVADGGLDRILQSNNPSLLRDTNINDKTVRSLYGAISSDLEIFKGLKNVTRLGFSLYNQDEDRFQKRVSQDVVVGPVVNPNQLVSRDRDQSLRTNVSTNFTYDNKFGKHRFDTSLIFEISSEKINRVNSVQVSDQTLDDFNAIYNNLPSTTFTNVQTKNISSQVFRLNYDYAGKYLLAGSIRRDVASNLSPVNNNNEGYFPALSVGWIASRESFLQGNTVISNLKFKGSIGVTANNSIPANSTRSNILNNTAVVFGDGPEVAFVPETFASDNLKWETSEKLNYGVDLELFNKFNINAEYFISKNKDLLVREPLSTSFGLSEDPFRNIGEIQVDGYEFTVGYTDNQGKFKWNAQANITFLDQQLNKVGRGDDSTIPAGESRNFNNQFLNILKKGGPLYGIQGLKVDGLFRSIDELKQAPLQEQVFREIGVSDRRLTRETVIDDATGVASYVFRSDDGLRTISYDNVTVDTEGTYLGDIRYGEVNRTRDKDGNYVVNSSDDLTVIGDPNPDFNFGFDLNMEYKGFDFNVFFSGVYGNDVVNATRRGLLAFNGIGNLDVSVLDRYREAPKPEDVDAIRAINPAFLEANTNTNVPRFDVAQERNTFISERFIEDGSYIRLKNISLGYTIPKNSLTSSSIPLSKVRIYVSAQNLFTYSKYSGLDPEVRPSWSSRIESVGIDNGFPPLPTTIQAGLEIEF